MHFAPQLIIREKLTRKIIDDVELHVLRRLPMTLSLIDKPIVNLLLI